MKAQAFKPTYINFPIKEEKKVEGKATDEEISLQALSVTSGWKVLSEYIDRLLKDLDNITSKSMETGLSLEEIGKNAVVADMAKGIVNRIKTKVSDAKEIVERVNE